MRTGTVLPSGSEILKRRTSRGWTQETLAEKTHGSLRAIQRAEVGRFCFVPLLTLRMPSAARLGCYWPGPPPTATAVENHNSVSPLGLGTAPPVPMILSDEVLIS